MIGWTAELVAGTLVMGVLLLLGVLRIAVWLVEWGLCLFVGVR